jgi:hypothetical protein
MPSNTSIFRFRNALNEGSASDSARTAQCQCRCSSSMCQCGRVAADGVQRYMPSRKALNLVIAQGLTRKNFTWAPVSMLHISFSTSSPNIGSERQMLRERMSWMSPKLREASRWAAEFGREAGRGRGRSACRIALQSKSTKIIDKDPGPSLTCDHRSACCGTAAGTPRPPCRRAPCRSRTWPGESQLRRCG